MFGSKKTIKVQVKLYGGLDAFAGIENYDPDVGLRLEVPENTRLGKAIKKTGLEKAGSIRFFVNGNAATLRDVLENGDVVFCMRPTAGG